MSENIMEGPGGVRIKLEIDESKITVYRYAQRMRDYAVKHLESLENLSGEASSQVREAIDWLKSLEP